MAKNPYSTKFYKEREKEREKTGKSAFEYHEKMKTVSASEKKCHDMLNPYGVTRESRDHDLQPQSIAAMVSFDGTGSMHQLPFLFQKQLPNLMDTLVKKGLDSAQLLFSTHGDVKWDTIKCPQFGQFEMGNVMEDDLSRMLFEGGGGSYGEEDYALMVYFAAYHTSIDCFEKRGRKGYLHLIGDEVAYNVITPSEVKVAFGDDIAQPLTFAHVLAAAKEKYEIFFYLPTGSSGSGTHSSVIINFWTEHLGQDHVVIMEKPEQICDVIASTMVLFEGLDDLEGLMKDHSPSEKASLSRALARVSESASTRVPTRSAVMEGELVSLDPAETAVERL